MVCGCRKIDGAVGSGGVAGGHQLGLIAWTQPEDRAEQSCGHGDWKVAEITKVWLHVIVRSLLKINGRFSCNAAFVCLRSSAGCCWYFLPKCPKSHKKPTENYKKGLFCCFCNVWSDMNIKINNNTVLRSLTVQKDNCKVYICLRMCKKTKQTTFVLLSLW